MVYVTQFIICVLLSVAMPTWSCLPDRDPTPEATPEPVDDGIDVRRSDWHARTPVSTSTLSTPIKYVFIHHTEGDPCTSQSGCSSVVREIQNYDMDTKLKSDIGYSFLIGEDGNVYEGRGWDQVGGHTDEYNDVGIGIAFMGTFKSRKPNTVALDAAKHLIARGVSLGKLRSNYTLRGHRDVVSSTSCPGNSLHAEIKTWSHY